MRLLFFVLLLANVLAAGYYSYRDDRGHAAKIAHTPLNADRIRLIDASRNAPSQGPSPTSDVAGPSCYEWVGLTPEAAEQAQRALAKLGFGEKVTRGRTETYWVYIPALKTRQEAEKKLKELIALGIEGSRVIEQADNSPFAILLGAYPTAEVALVRLNQLKELGVKSAALDKRETIDDRFELLAEDVALLAQLNRLKADFPGTAWRAETCPVRSAASGSR